MIGRAPLVALTLLLFGAAPSPAPERIQSNDNLQPAGTLTRGVLRLRLDARLGMWHPDGEGAPGAEVPAFAEVGARPQIPGPFVRVPAGTEVEATVTNSLAGSTLTVHGLLSRPAREGEREEFNVRPGETRTLRFVLDAPGTYFYWGSTTGKSLGNREGVDAQLSGAIVVDPVGAPRPARDRVLVIGLWREPPDSTQGQRLLVVLNGRSWPHTTRLAATVGDTVRWRVVNPTTDVHPMHLHGTYFSVDARGTQGRDSAYDEARRDRVVTELLWPGQTFAMSWVPERPGNWLFHCHFTVHFTARDPLGRERPATVQPASGAAGPDGGHARHAANHATNHALTDMSGLVLGVTVRPRAGAGALAPDASRRRIRLLARASAGGTAELPLYAFALHEPGAEPPADSGPKAGPPLVLRRGEPVAITVVNRLPEPTAVHWHGMELESYYDGVAGFSGDARRLAPVIAPGDSFVARFTPPRAGTFIYHTHVDEMRQQPAGLSGVLIVADDAYDAATDVPVLLTTPRDPRDAARAVQFNGRLAPTPVELRAGATYRLRLVNITIDRPGMRLALTRDSASVRWTPLAVDGADLPTWRRVERAAEQPITIGQTLDFAFTPGTPGDYRLEGRTSGGVVIGALTLRVR